MSSENRSTQRLTAVFAKAPRAGEVKTRLVPPLSAEQAATLAEAMLEDEVERLAASDAFRTAVAYAPAQARAWFAERFPGVALCGQAGHGLAARLEHFFATELAAGGASTVVVVGSDAPTLDVQRVVEAHRRLEGGCDVVLGPDGSGGYYLVGLARPRPELFTRVEMSTPDMFARTVALAEELGLSVALLPQGLDVDTERELDELRRECEQRDPAAPGFPSRTWKVLQRIGAPK